MFNVLKVDRDYETARARPPIVAPDAFNFAFDVLDRRAREADKNRVDRD